MFLLHINKWLIVFLVLLLSGCASDNVFYYQQANMENLNNQRAPETIKIYIDAFGNIYPNTGYPFKEFTPNTSTSGSLFDQLSHKSSTFCDRNTLTAEDESFELCKAIKSEICYPEDKSCFTNPAWQLAQTKLWLNAGKNIHASAMKQNKSSLLFLIHGFNNNAKESAENLQLLSSEVNSYYKSNEKESPLIIKIFWDGFTGIPVLTKVWGDAQYSGPLVGLNLRQLFRGVQMAYGSEPPKLRIITHSSGAFVVGALLGNPYVALPRLHDGKPQEPEYVHFGLNKEGLSEEYPIPNFPEIRVGMIAAATPTVTFKGNRALDSSMNSGILSANTKLVFTVNANDVVLSKGFGLSGFAGATNSGTDVDQYCKDLDDLESSIGAIETFSYDFAHEDPTFWYFWDKHGVDTYLSHKNAKSFFQNVLGLNTKKASICNAGGPKDDASKS
jgi:hypothetical protein